MDGKGRMRQRRGEAREKNPEDRNKVQGTVSECVCVRAESVRSGGGAATFAAGAAGADSICVVVKCASTAPPADSSFPASFVPPTSGNLDLASLLRLLSYTKSEQLGFGKYYEQLHALFPPCDSI